MSDERKYGMSKDRHAIAEARNVISRAGLTAPQVVSALAEPYLEMAIRNLASIAEDSSSRQQRQACVDLINAYANGASTEKAGAGEARVIVVREKDMAEIERSLMTGGE